MPTTMAPLPWRKCRLSCAGTSRAVLPDRTRHCERRRNEDARFRWRDDANAEAQNVFVVVSAFDQSGHACFQAAGLTRYNAKP